MMSKFSSVAILFLTSTPLIVEFFIHDRHAPNSIFIAGVQQIRFAHADYYDSWGDFSIFFDVSADAANKLQWWPRSPRSGKLI